MCVSLPKLATIRMIGTRELTEFCCEKCSVLKCVLKILSFEQFTVHELMELRTNFRSLGSVFDVNL